MKQRGKREGVMKNTKHAGLDFLKTMDQSELQKEQIFEALFDICGVSDAVNVKHVFFQDVIIKFNAQKARNLIEQGASIVNESHYVDVALWTYIRSGYLMKNFADDLQEFKSQYSNCPQLVMPQPPKAFANI